jgi:hypothetical protein
MAQYFEVHPDNPQPRLLKQGAMLLQKGGILAVPTATWTTRTRWTACGASGKWMKSTT